jgi:hypothetical protein
MRSKIDDADISDEEINLDQVIVHTNFTWQKPSLSASLEGESRVHSRSTSLLDLFDEPVPIMTTNTFQDNISVSMFKIPKEPESNLNIQD